MQSKTKQKSCDNCKHEDGRWRFQGIKCNLHYKKFPNTKPCNNHEYKEVSQDDSKA